ncbi:ferritin-like domain-containing protein [Streptomyces sp. NBC_01317]|uniref:ferritin-like domain-containing protein n=1 Tax=Streptomyces sp. NBC_01317 TaxID=2903822 RepID=UPI002E102E22|nr:ferritin-like domain-containing protein [Streptomyces sp. NBC_01317]
MSTTQRGWELPLSEAQLDRLTKDMDEAHRETLPAMRAGAAALTEQVRDADGPADRGRRSFLLGAGGVGAAFVLAACSSGKGSSSSSAPTDLDSPAVAAKAETYTGDLRVVALAVALENQAVGAYKATLAAAKAGKLGTVPPAVASFVTKAMAQHADHAKAWNAVLTNAGKPAITNVPLSNQAQVTAALGKAKNVGEVAALALQLEDQAAETYLFATFNVKSQGAIETAATIAPVEAMHAAILHFVLGQYPVPDTFLPVNKAAKTSLLTV